ncbi:major facilitator superfamily domain-containing protein 4A-like [Babylonia areolata]|uniref:major facilitator superfamily domain-containing protein 4A-like n=1 Tax=Babylonia areolata TaxID=304850 RepID=UPI003FD275F3
MTTNGLSLHNHHTTSSSTMSETENSADEGKVSEWIEHTTIQPREVEEKVSFCKLFTDNWLYVLTYCCVFGSFGVCVGLLGPTVFDLGCQTSSDQREMNWVFFVQLIMTLVGSISAGCMAQSVPNHMLMLCSGIGVSVSMFIIPACESLATLLFVLILMGWCMGCLDCLANLRMILLFGKHVSPFLQAMHCFYGLGAFVSPMIASAFLLNKDCSPFIDGFTIQTPVEDPHPGPGGLDNVTYHSATVHIAPQPQRVFRYRHMSRVPVAFFILGGLQLSIALLVGYVMFLEKVRGLRPKGLTFDGPHLHHPHVTSPSNGFSLRTRLRELAGSCGPRDTALVALLTCVCLFLFDGLQSSFANYIYTYAHDSHLEGLKKYEGAVLDACFWGLFSLGRMIAVPIAARFTAAFMLLINITGCSTALLLTLLFRWSHVMIYIGTCFVGVFVSSMSPTVMSMCEQFVDINPTITTCLVVVAALGEALCPIIVGNLVVSVGPSSFLAFCLTFSLVSLVVYWLLLLAGRQSPKYKASKTDSFIFLSGKQLVLEGESTLIKPNSVKYYSRMEDSDSNPEMDPSTLLPNNGPASRTFTIEDK